MVGCTDNKSVGALFEGTAQLQWTVHCILHFVLSTKADFVTIFFMRCLSDCKTCWSHIEVTVHKLHRQWVLLMGPANVEQLLQVAADM